MAGLVIVRATLVWRVALGEYFQGLAARYIIGSELLVTSSYALNPLTEYSAAATARQYLSKHRC
jgi:hypothetical protein